MSTINNLVKTYGDFKLEIPRWELSDRGVTALWGPSGSGKTSVIRLLIGLDECPDLQWIFERVDIAKLPVPDKRLGVVFQSLELFPHMTASENILFAARARKIPEAHSRLQELADILELSNCIERKVSVLSGGEQQRVALARAIVGQPRFLFLDEPFSALDAKLRDKARQLVRQTISHYEIPALLITHDPQDLEVVADQVVEIQQGSLVK